MIFQSNIPNHCYVIRSSEPQYGPHGHPIKGTESKPLRAKFRGAQRLFDSEAAQKAHGWSDEERLQVEAFLLGDEDFMAAAVPGGVGAQPRIYLVRGQAVPRKHEKLYRSTLERLSAEGRLPASEVEEAADALPAPPMYCLAFETTADGLVRCPKLAAQGSDFCEEDHKAEVSVA